MSECAGVVQADAKHLLTFVTYFELHSNMAAVSVSDTLTAVNEALKAQSYPLNQYSCSFVSWDDASRASSGAGLSCWGSNITDTTLNAKSGQALFTVRSDNWNEKLGKVSADDVSVLAGETEPNCELQPITLRKWLRHAGLYGSYAGVGDGCDLSSELDSEVSIRFQTVFLPVGGEELATMEFAPSAYNYNTRSDDDPKNLLLLCTSQGTFVQQDGAGEQRLALHGLEGGVVSRYWMEAERSTHKVGGAQKETEAEIEKAAARGKAVARTIGVKAMGTRFNVLMTVQVPLKQAHRESLDFFMACASFGESKVAGGGGCAPLSYSMSSSSYDNFCMPPSMPCAPSGVRLCRKASPVIGTANAARVSRGSKIGPWDGLTVKNPVRHDTEHATVTVVMYYTVAGGVPSAADVVRAVEDLEAMYAGCGWTGRLADEGAGFMKTDH